MRSLRSKLPGRGQQFIAGFAFPTAAYLVLFLLLTYPLCTFFWDEFFGLWFGDPTVSLWNLWWVKRALIELHQLPWFTPDLFYPKGASLLGHTLCPYAGLVYIVLSPWLNVVQAYNFILVLSFVLSGLMAFYLCRKLTGSYWGSLAGGFVYTFSSYHFIHHAHMNLFNMQWIPAFFLAWYCFLESPRSTRAALVSLTLLLNVLCDYYYTMYCVLGAVVVYAWFAVRRRDPVFLLRRKHLLPTLTFLLPTLLTTGLLCGAFVLNNRADSFVGAHDPSQFSLDLASVAAPGVGWRFYQLTEFYWSSIPDVTSSYHLGTAAIIMAILVALRRKHMRESCPSAILWMILGSLFFLCALGPVIRVLGHEVLATATPYGILKGMIPVLKMGGVPARMIVITQLALAILVAAFLQHAMQSNIRWRITAGILLCILVVESLPGKLFHTPLPTPGHALVLAEQDKPGAFLDAATPWLHRGYMIAQMTHQKPICAGALARRNRSTERHGELIGILFRRQRFDRLVHEFGYRYFLTAEPLEIASAEFQTELLYSGQDGFLYYLSETP